MSAAEHGLDLAQGAGLDAEQALDDVQMDVRRVAVAHERRVGQHHVAGESDDEGATLLDASRRLAGRWSRWRAGAALAAGASLGALELVDVPHAANAIAAAATSTPMRSRIMCSLLLSILASVIDARGLPTPARPVRRETAQS